MAAEGSALRARIRVALMASEEPLTVARVAAAVKVRAALAAYHLAVLEQEGAVIRIAPSGERVGAEAEAYRYALAL